jgi:MFS-type transporter involved in bile tolerance (Atg22 family)
MLEKFVSKFQATIPNNSTFQAPYFPHLKTYDAFHQVINLCWHLCALIVVVFNVPLQTLMEQSTYIQFVQTSLTANPFVSDFKNKIKAFWLKLGTGIIYFLS